MTYAEKLQDPRWQKKRLQILDRDNFKCQRCEDTTATLHVHHKYYEKNKDPWEYDNKHLITLCADCHELEDQELKDNSELLIDTFRRSSFNAGHMMDFAEGIKYIGNVEDEDPNCVMRAFYMAMKNDEARNTVINMYKEFLADTYLSTSSEK